MSGQNTEQTEKQDLVSFISSRYDVEREYAYRLVDMDDIPEDPRNLCFTKNKMIYSNDESVGELTEEFLSHFQNLEDIINLNLNNPPTFKKGYIEQCEISKEAERKARENPRITTRSIISEEKFKSIVDRISRELEFLSGEIDKCEISDEFNSQLKVIIALIKYTLDLDGSVHIKNAYRVLRYAVAHKKVSEGRQQHTYSKLGNKIDVIFDDTNLVPDELYPYYDGNISELVEIVDKSLNQMDS